MGLKDLAQKLLRGRSYRQEKIAEADENIRVEKIVNERQLSSDERELAGYYREEEKKQIKEQLDHFRKRRNDELWHGPTMLQEKNIFKGEKSMLKQKNIFNGSRNKSLLKQRSSFIR